MSARERKPLTGRSNLSRQEERRENASGNFSNQSSSIPSLTASQKVRCNDTLMVSRAFSPRDPFSKPVKIQPPIFPTSRFPTIPPYDPASEQPRRRRPLTCPQKWISESQKPHAFDTSALTGDLEPEEKRRYCQEFLERNQSNLWQYDQQYRHKTPRTICDEITEDFNYLAIMTKFHKKEKVIGLSNSNNIKDILHYGGEKMSETRITDPYVMSLTTSRSARQRKVESMVEPILHEDNSKFRRGYDHAPEYGNFSKFNSLLKQNAGSVLKR